MLEERLRKCSKVNNVLRNLTINEGWQLLTRPSKVIEYKVIGTSRLELELDRADSRTG